MLNIVNIEVHYMQVIYVVHGIYLEVPEDSIVALLGSNGAGKSTTLKAISGLLKKIFWLGLMHVQIEKK